MGLHEAINLAEQTVPMDVCALGVVSLNHRLMKYNRLNFDQAVKIRSRLIKRVTHKHKLTCRAHMEVVETYFLTGELAETVQYPGLILRFESTLYRRQV